MTSEFKVENPFIIGKWYGMEDDGYSFECEEERGVYVLDEEQSSRLYQEKLIRMGCASDTSYISMSNVPYEDGSPSREWDTSAVDLVSEHEVLMDMEAAIARTWEHRKEAMSPLHQWLLEEAAVACYNVAKDWLIGTKAEKWLKKRG
jgi:hypothetical protein